MLEVMNIAVLGAGRIGSVFAYHLARAGHTVTAIARGTRLGELRREEGIVAVDGTRAQVHVAEALDVATPFDLVIVTVLRHQIDALLPALEASAARAVLFVFNTFDPIDVWRDAIGAERFSFAFPSMLAFLEDGRLRSNVVGPGLATTTDSPRWAEVLRGAGMPAEVEPDMNAWLRSHVAFVVPTMLAANLVWQRPTGLTWGEAKALAATWDEGFALVRALGHDVRPGPIAAVARLPRFVLAPLLWLAARSSAVKDLGAFGPGEVRALIDAMAASSPGSTPRLAALRP